MVLERSMISSGHGYDCDATILAIDGCGYTAALFLSSWESEEHHRKGTIDITLMSGYKATKYSLMTI